jgi:predicted RNA polymerase sigma factor
LAEMKGVPGALEALVALDEIATDARLTEYQPYWAARAEILAKLLGKTGANDEARHAYSVAIGLERDDAVRNFLQQRQAALPS